MNHSSLSFVAACFFVIACGGQTLPAPGDQDAGSDAVGNETSTPVECHGFCPQPNGSACTSDCDCNDKCLGNVCATATTTSATCSDAIACQAGQKCGPFGACEGMTCTTTDDCPAKQQCLSGACAAFGCL